MSPRCVVCRPGKAVGSEAVSEEAHSNAGAFLIPAAVLAEPRIPAGGSRSPPTSPLAAPLHFPAGGAQICALPPLVELCRGSALAGARSEGSRRVCNKDSAFWGPFAFTWRWHRCRPAFV